MKTLKDLLDMPLPQLGELLKRFLETADVILKENTLIKTEETPIEEVKEEKPKLPDDLAAVIEFNKAIAEKYQATGAESLLDHLTTQLAKERGVNPEDTVDGVKIGDTLKEEIKSALEVTPEHRELLKLDKDERAEFGTKKTIKENGNLVDKVLDGDKEALKDLDKKILDNSYGTVNTGDLPFILRSELRNIATKRAEQKEEKSDDE
jgi:hypothetical protein